MEKIAEVAENAESAEVGAAAGGRVGETDLMISEGARDQRVMNAPILEACGHDRGADAR